MKTILSCKKILFKQALRHKVINNKIISKQIIINGLLINYYFFLPDKKPIKTLVFLHGWGVDSQLWFKIVPALINKNYSLYFLDLPGFGQSQVPNTTYGVDEYKKIVYEFVKKLELKNINLIGHSFGGRITIKMAAENPNFLQKVVLVDSAGIYHHSQVKTLKLLIASIIRPLFQFSFMQSFRRKIYQITDSEEYLTIPALSKTFSYIISEDLTPYLSKIKLPTLIIWGDKDHNEASTIADAQLMKKSIKNSKLEILKKAGHFSFLDQPKAFVKALTDFI